MPNACDLLSNPVVVLHHPQLNAERGIGYPCEVNLERLAVAVAVAWRVERTAVTEGMKHPLARTREK